MIPLQPLIFGVYEKGREARQLAVIEPDGILEINIAEGGLPPTTITIKLNPKYHSTLETITKEALEKKMVIKVGGEILFSGTIKEPIANGAIALTFSSTAAAEEFVRKIGGEPHRTRAPQSTRGPLEASEAYAGLTKIDGPKKPWMPLNMETLKGQKSL